MNRPFLRTVITICALATAAIHLYLNVLMGKFDLLFTLNGLGYLTLLSAWYFQPASLRPYRNLVVPAFLGFTGLTILAWIFLGNLSDPLGVTTKVIELVLIGGLIMDWRLERTGA